MVRHDLRTNTSAPWYAPSALPPPLTNTQTGTYINYHVLWCCRYLWRIEMLQVCGSAKKGEDVKPAAQDIG